MNLHSGFNHALKCVFNLINFYIFASCMDPAQRMVSFKVDKLTRIDGCVCKFRHEVERCLVIYSYKGPFIKFDFMTPLRAGFVGIHLWQCIDEDGLITLP